MITYELNKKANGWSVPLEFKERLVASLAAS